MVQLSHRPVKSNSAVSSRLLMALRAGGWAWLALFAALYALMIYDTLRWEQTAGLVAVFKRSGADIALAAAGTLAPGVLAVLAASVLGALRTGSKRGDAPTSAGRYRFLTRSRACICQAHTIVIVHQQHPRAVDCTIDSVFGWFVYILRRTTKKLLPR